MRIVRVNGACDFPCDVLLVAAMNPCPCGYLGDPRRACACGPRERSRYARRVSGPLLDRIDLRISVGAVDWKDLRSAEDGEPSASIRKRVSEARRRAGQRRPHSPGFRNADLSAQELGQHGALDPAGKKLLEVAFERLHLSVRALHRALRVARTIADLETSERIRTTHLAEALSYRGFGLAAACPHDQVDSRGRAS